MNSNFVCILTHIQMLKKILNGLKISRGKNPISKQHFESPKKPSIRKNSPKSSRAFPQIFPKSLQPSNVWGPQCAPDVRAITNREKSGKQKGGPGVAKARSVLAGLSLADNVGRSWRRAAETFPREIRKSGGRRAELSLVSCIFFFVRVFLTMDGWGEGLGL